MEEPLMQKDKKSIRPAFSGTAHVTAAGLRRALDPPHDNTQDVLHGVTVKDPFRPLENLTAPETVAWMARENQKVDDFMQAGKSVEAQVMAFFEKTRPRGMRETMPEKHGDKYFVWRREETAARPSLYVKDVPDYGAPARLLLDPLEIDPTGKTAITFFSATVDGKTVAYALNTSGSDKGTLKFIDAETGKKIDLTYPNFRTNVNATIKWDNDGCGFYYNHSDDTTKSSDVRYHKMGTPAKDDKVIYAPNAAETGAEIFRVQRDFKGAPAAYDYITRFVAINSDECDKNALLVRPAGSSGPFREIFPLKEGLLTPIHETGARTLSLTNFKAANGRLVSIDVNNPSPDKWQTILPEDKNDPLKDVFVWQNKIFATYTHDTGQVLRVFDLAGKHLHDAPIPPLSRFAVGQVREDDTTCLITCDSFQESASVYKYDAEANTLALFKKSATPIDLKDCIVERIQATSKDGTKVPMTVIRSKDTKLDGTAATLLYGYGGFNIPMDPGFNASIAQWVRDGGIYVMANLRGGGEFGQKWYDGGRLKNKQNVFDDFAACGEHLIDKKYTTNKRLAIQGGSNGGLLTLATMLQRPDLFGAVVSEVPVADMFRFHIGSHEGFSWKSDYGDPDVKADFNVAAKYSPLHNVKKGFKHPPLLIKTDINDDRVLPWHSLKMAATLQSLEDPRSLTLLKIRTDGGHSAGMTEEQRYADIAGVRAFLAETLGPINQRAYKAKLAQEKKSAARYSRKPKRG